jgi:hypothetical protein
MTDEQARSRHHGQSSAGTPKLADPIRFAPWNLIRFDLCDLWSTASEWIGWNADLRSSFLNTIRLIGDGRERRLGILNR